VKEEGGSGRRNFRPSQCWKQIDATAVLLSKCRATVFIIFDCYCLLVIVYGTLESVAVLWRLRSYHD